MNDDNEIIEKWLNKCNNARTATTYKNGLNKFLKETNLTPSELLKMPLKEIENKFEDFVEAHKYTEHNITQKTAFAPKKLNIIFCALKHFLWKNRVLDNRKMFREIAFEKTKRSTRDETMITPELLRKMFDCADIHEKVILGLYGLASVNPEVMQRLTVKDIYEADRKIINGKIELKKPVTAILTERKGGHAQLILLTQELTEWLQQSLNANNATLDSKLITIKDVEYVVKKLKENVGFHGRAYLLRHLAKKMLKECGDADLVEFLMGHTGKISSIYDSGHFISEWEMNAYKTTFLKAQTIMRIYGRTDDETRDANTMINLARGLGVNDETIKKFMEIFNAGKMSVEQLRNNLITESNNAITTKIRTEIKGLIRDEIANGHN